jgi:hypothetical protein
LLGTILGAFLFAACPQSGPASTSAGATGTTGGGASGNSSGGGSGGSISTTGSATTGALRPWPDTSASIRVFSDQFDVSSATDAQLQFAATHYAGAQKLLAGEVAKLRAYAPGFLLLHYRLGQALGDSTPSAECQPTNNYIQIIDGDSWVQEWPVDSAVQESWFYHLGTDRVFNCTFGWYLAQLDSPAWLAYWPPLVVQQLQACDADGLFADSFSIPNYFGATDFNPGLPVVDAGFEDDWATLEHNFTDTMRTIFAGRYLWIPNIGSYITTRDPSDYSNVDGAMIEGFAELGGGNYLAPSDWALQQDRVLALVSADKILLAQTYPTDTDVNERMFILGTYLLVKGARTYVNLDAEGLQIQWFPEYGIDLGAATDPLPARIASLQDVASQLYIRHYANGLVLVNPSGAAGSYPLGATLYQVVPSGGGVVPSDGSIPGSLSTTPVTTVTLQPETAAILLNSSL